MQQPPWSAPPTSPQLVETPECSDRGAEQHDHAGDFQWARERPLQDRTRCIRANGGAVGVTGKWHLGGGVECFPAGLGEPNFDPCVCIAGLDLEHSRDPVANPGDVAGGETGRNAL